MQHNTSVHRVFLLSCLLVGSGACQRPEERCHVAPAASPPPAPVVTTVDHVKEEPLRFLDREVQIVGDTAKVHSDRAFELEGTGWAFDDNITVLTRTPVHVVGGPPFFKDRLIVSGVVRRFDAAELEHELGWIFPLELKAALKDRPVIVADTIDKIWHFGRWTSAPGVRPVGNLIAIAAAIDLNALVDQKIELKGERVQAMTGKGIWVGPNAMSQVLVIPAGAAPELHVGDAIDISGVLRKVPDSPVALWKLPASMAFVVRPGTLYVDAATIHPTPGRTP